MSQTRPAGGAGREQGDRSAEPAPSATVVLARAGSPAPEFLLVRRHARAAFGASHVFPGGRVEVQDRTALRHCRSLSAAEANRCLGLEEGALVDGHELTDSCWITAAEALAAGLRGELKLPPPTAATLRDLSVSAGLDELQAWAGQRAIAGVSPVLPVIETRHGRERVIMPGDADHPADAGERR